MPTGSTSKIGAEMTRNPLVRKLTYTGSTDVGRLMRVAERLASGMVGVNTGLIPTAEAPFCGVKQSGLGRAGSKYGLDECQEIKNICLAGIAASPMDRIDSCLSSGGFRL